MPLIETKGAASAQGFGEFAKTGPANYIEDVFSTYLYTGNGSTQTITNGIDLSTKGGLVWIKDRTQGTTNYGHYLFDTSRGATKYLTTNTTNAQGTSATTLTAFNADGFSLDLLYPTNNGGDNYASWTFRKQPKFFDVVTYTGNGVAGRTVAHNLGSVPGCIIVKSTSNATAWPVYHRSLGATKYLALNTTDASTTNSAWWNNTEPTDTAFTVGTTQSTNQTGYTYVAYLFAHNAGGFGLTGTDNVISCGSITGSNSLASYSLGYEPQWLLIKPASTTGNWTIYNTMEGWTADGDGLKLYPNLSDSETPFSGQSGPTSTGFTYYGTTGVTYIYIAIRRGPMKVPTDGTKVFNATATSTDTATTGFPVDLMIEQPRTTAGVGAYWADRLRGGGNALTSSSTAAESAGFFASTWSQSNIGVTNTGLGFGSSVLWSMQRAPGFFDEVCYTGNATAGRTLNHNLGVVPELMIVKDRSNATNWGVWNKDIFAANSANILILQLANAATSGGGSYFNSTAPTSSVFTVGSASATNGSSGNFVAYLFASCPGVSKVGSYTGNGSTQTINCGFTGGARFVLIKRTDSTGDWYVYDTARGMTTLTDPYLLLNSTAAESATLGSVTTVSTGFAVNASILAAINTNGASYIYLSIA